MTLKGICNFFVCVTEWLFQARSSGPRLPVALSFGWQSFSWENEKETPLPAGKRVQ